MPRIVIKQPGQDVKWIKEINKLTGEVTFTNNPAEAFVREGSFYCNSEIKTLQNPLMYDHEKYPELKYAEIEGGRCY